MQLRINNLCVWPFHSAHSVNYIDNCDSLQCGPLWSTPFVSKYDIISFYSSYFHVSSSVLFNAKYSPFTHTCCWRFLSTCRWKESTIYLTLPTSLRFTVGDRDVGNQHPNPSILHSCNRRQLDFQRFKVTRKRVRRNHPLGLDCCWMSAHRQND